jgi:hypothetical protein
MAKAANPGKPIFVFLHWPIQNTFYVSDEWYTSSFGSNPSDYFFKDDPEVVVFGGHIHSPNSDPRSIWQDGFTSVNTATLHYMEMEAAGSPKKYLGDSSNGISTSSTPRHPILRDARTATGADIGTYTSGPAAQGMIVSVKGSEVIIENFDFDVSTGPTNNVEKIPQTWKFDVAHPESFPYTQTKRTSEKAAPLFDASTPSGMAVNGKIRIVQAGSTSIIVNFDQARMPSFKPDGEVVHSYRFEIWNKEPVPSLERTAYQWSDFMYTPRLQKTTYTQLLGGLQAGTEYELRIYAYGSFQECSAQYLTVDFTTAESVNFDIKFQNNLLNASSPPARVSVTGMASYDNGVRTGEKAIKLNGNNYIQLDRAAPSFNYSQSFTIAFWVKVISTRGSDPVIFSNKSWSNGNNNGFLLMVKGNNILLNSKSVSDSERLNGSSDISIASGAGNVWTHIAVVYDKTAGTNGEVRYYKDGNVVGTLATNLTNGIDGGQHSYLGQSANGDLLYQGSSGSYDVEFLMQDFLLSGGALLDSEIQNLATP